jgi:hypothetical protein
MRAATAAPYFTIRIVKTPLKAPSSREGFFTAQASEKKQQKLSLHCGMDGTACRKKTPLSSDEKSGV